MILCKSFGRMSKTKNQKARMRIFYKMRFRNISSARGEPASYLHVHTAGLIALAEAGALKKPEQEFDEALRKTNALFESALKDDERFIHYSTGENVDTGMWGLGFDFAAITRLRSDEE